MAAQSSPRNPPAEPFRIGHGYDLHRLEPINPHLTPGSGQVARPMILAGVHFPDSPVGPVGHSDGDAVYHAVTDAVLGALALPDIGQLFPDTDPRHAAADSAQFLDEAVRRMTEAQYTLNNIDITIICERPKVSPHKTAMLNNLVQHLHCLPDQVNLKGKTHEKLGALGEGRAVEVHVVALLAAKSTPGHQRV